MTIDAEFEKYFKTYYPSENIPAQQRREVRQAFIAGVVVGFYKTAECSLPDLTEDEGVVLLERLSKEIDQEVEIITHSYSNRN